MDTRLPSDPQFVKNYNKHRKHLKLNGLQTKTIDAYSRAIRRIGSYFDCHLNDKQLQGLAGFTTVLHTHSRRLDFHPHIHVMMPAASINCETKLWRVKSAKFIFYHKNLAKVFRAKLLEKMVDQQLKVPHNCSKKWVVDCKYVGNGDKALIYLGKYLYKGVIQEKDILKCENGMVTFRYVDSKTEKPKTRTVTGEDFLWLLMRHVLPKSFRKARCYGFLHP